MFNGLFDSSRGNLSCLFIIRVFELDWIASMFIRTLLSCGYAVTKRIGLNVGVARITLVDQNTGIDCHVFFFIFDQWISAFSLIDFLYLIILSIIWSSQNKTMSLKLFDGPTPQDIHPSDKDEIELYLTLDLETRANISTSYPKSQIFYSMRMINSPRHISPRKSVSGSQKLIKMLSQ